MGNAARAVIRLPVDVAPCRGHVRPDQNLKPLDEPVITGPAGKCISHVSTQPVGLYVAEQADAYRRDMDGASADAIDIETAVAVPSLQVEGTLAFASRLLELSQPAGQFIADRNHPSGVVAEDFVQLLEGRIHDDQPLWLGFAKAAVRCDGVRRSLLYRAFELFLPRLPRQFDLFSFEFEIAGFLLVGFSPQLLDLLQRLSYGLHHRAFQKPGLGDNGSPRVGHDRPIVPAFRPDRGATIHAPRKANQRIRGRKIRRSLHALRGVVNQWSEAGREEFQRETLDR